MINNLEYILPEVGNRCHRRYWERLTGEHSDFVGPRDKPFKTIREDEQLVNLGHQKRTIMILRKFRKYKYKLNEIRR